MTVPPAKSESCYGLFNSFEPMLVTVFRGFLGILALIFIAYLFSRNRKLQRRVVETIPFGGGCINDTVIHLATCSMPFGGIGESGMGSYHGKTGFESFSHFRSIVDKKTWMDLPIRYQKYTQKKEKLLRLFLQ